MQPPQSWLKYVLKGFCLTALQTKASKSTIKSIHRLRQSIPVGEDGGGLVLSHFVLRFKCLQ